MLVFQFASVIYSTIRTRLTLMCSQTTKYDFLTLIHLNGYNSTNNHYIDLKVVFWESEEQFTHFRLTNCELSKINCTIIAESSMVQ